MLKLRYMVGLVVLLLGLVVQPLAAAPAASGLTRFFFVSNTYSDWVVKLDGRELLRTQTNTLSDYIAVPSDRGHTLEIFGYGMGIRETPVNRTENYAMGAGGHGLAIYNDKGVVMGQIDAENAPANRSLLNVIWAPGAGPELEVFYDNVRFATQAFGTLSVTRTVEPSNGRLELRTARGKVIRSQFLRAQPGYRYEIIVTRPSNRDEDSLIAVRPVSPHLQAFPTETITFMQTGHYLDGRLRQYWEGTGGLPVFGYPLNDDHLTKTPEGRYVTQTFERNRLEYHPEKTAPYDVLLGRLGAERLVQLGRDWRKEWTRQPIGEGCMPLFAETTEFALCEPFRTYYRTHGLELDGQRGFTYEESLALFGLPLTQAKMETNSSGDRVLTQWFERARFEYHPKNPQGQQVLLGRLGAEVYDLQPLTFDDEDRGFQRMSDIGVSDWNEAEGGIGGHFWWTCTEGVGGKQYSGTRMARWIGPRVPQGTYDVQVFVPGTHAGSTSVPYTVRVSLDDGVVQRLNQSPWSNQWAKLITLELGSAVSVDINTNSGERGSCAHHLAADAIRLVPR